jgi:hypothetical protein
MHNAPTSPFDVDARIVALSAEAWARDAGHCEHVARAALAGGDTRFLLLTSEALAGIKPLPSAVDTHGPKPVYVSLLTWLRASAQHYSADEERIAADLHVAADAELWVDASSFDNAALQDVLAHMRRILFGAPRWPAVMVFILRDDLLQSAMDLIPGTFYVLPTGKSLREASLYAYDVYRIARAARLFGWSPRSTKLSRVKKRLKSFWPKQLRRDLVDKIE